MNKKRLQKLVIELREYAKDLPVQDKVRIYEKLQALKSGTGLVSEVKNIQSINLNTVATDYLEEK